mmetsp:Transcript_6452/g.9414  ORF Transcript_6452/g.9414 Transcript_6452/m.9414 type:complete len:202 (-) Transcript_6452:122-727(-)|eukprot:CAMPEP_0196818306 /NCGR_PEP_ID=MMETSP1362-20130617/64985_1 /TAXON_ID=163516 /ORGANISM="Leptocylindrus danicus, Strain CCMP1856" /LENGTH=201 /DNA_ID=CAMNT_0042196351 /DNA_START=169 /DNA_END=774 /DNA_ORIENTATION=+
MVKHNNVVPNIHCHKKWHASQRGPLKVKLALNQAGKKKSRRLARAAKAAAMAPRPLRQLKPIVNCPTQRYNAKARLGRGFSVAELKAAGLTNTTYARTIGISVDKRRTNKSEESFARNVERLKAYLANVVVFPKKRGVAKPTDVPAQILGTVMPITKPAVECVVEDVPKLETSAFTTMRLARQETRVAGQRKAVEIRKAKD